MDRLPQIFSAVPFSSETIPCAKVVRYKRTTCRVESWFYSTQYVCPCTSGPTGSKQHCPSYPCLLVHASIQHCPSYPCLLVHVAVQRQAAADVIVPLFIDDRQQAAVHDADTDEPEMVATPLQLTLQQREDTAFESDMTGTLFFACYT